jgi:hypothetical protein
MGKPPSGAEGSLTYETKACMASAYDEDRDYHTTYESYT